MVRVAAYQAALVERLAQHELRQEGKSLTGNDQIK